MFILPVWREAGHFMMLSQYQDTCFLLTYLEVNVFSALFSTTVTMVPAITLGDTPDFLRDLSAQSGAMT